MFSKWQIPVRRGGRSPSVNRPLLPQLQASCCIAANRRLGPIAEVFEAFFAHRNWDSFWGREGPAMKLARRRFPHLAAGAVALPALDCEPPGRQRPAGYRSRPQPPRPASV
jgi:hypothetical protein